MLGFFLRFLVFIFSGFFRNFRRRGCSVLPAYTLTVNVCFCYPLSTGASTNLVHNASFPYFLKLRWGRVWGWNNTLSKHHIDKTRKDRRCMTNISHIQRKRCRGSSLHTLYTQSYALISQR